MKLRTIVFLGLAAVMLLPDPPPDDPLLQAVAAKGQPPVGTDAAELALAAMAAASDAGSFCQRQPQACITATRYWENFKLRLRYSVRLIYEWANGAPSPVIPEGSDARSGSHTNIDKAGLAPENADSDAVGRPSRMPITPKPEIGNLQVAPGGAFAGSASRTGAAQGKAMLQRTGLQPASGSMSVGLRLSRASVDDIITGSTIPVEPHPAGDLERRTDQTGKGSENTLTIEDIIVPWNGPRNASG